MVDRLQDFLIALFYCNLPALRTDRDIGAVVDARLEVRHGSDVLGRVWRFHTKKGRTPGSGPSHKSMAINSSWNVSYYASGSQTQGGNRNRAGE